MGEPLSEVASARVPPRATPGRRSASAERTPGFPASARDDTSAGVQEVATERAGSEPGMSPKSTQPEVRRKSARASALLGALALGASAACRAPEVPAPEDERAVRELVLESARRFNAHDADAWLELFAPDAQLVNVMGRRWDLPADREAVRTVFRTGLREAVMETREIELYFVRDDVALAQVTMLVGPFVDADGTRRPAELQRSLGVFTEQEGRWLVRAFHNTRVAAPPPEAADEGAR